MDDYNSDCHFDPNSNISVTPGAWTGKTCLGTPAAKCQNPDGCNQDEPSLPAESRHLCPLLKDYIVKAEPELQS